MKVHELLSDPKRWTKGAMARDASGGAVMPLSPSAEQYCLYGAIFKCYPGGTHLPVDTLRYYFGEGYDITHWNDAPSRIHAEVLEIAKKLDI